MDQAEQRRQRLVPVLREEGLDALLVSNAVNVTYLTGFSGESSHLILGRERTLLVSDARFTEQLASECPGLEVIIRPPEQNLYQAVAAALGKLGLHTVGFESAHVSVAEAELLRDLAKGVAWKPVRDRVETLRAIKDASEVEQIREAVAIAERAFAAFRALLREEDHEKDLSDAMEAHVRRAGGTCTSFPTIVAAGERAALPHAPPTKRTVGDSDLLLVDWGASGRFYKSDLTRVLPLRRISPKLQEVYAVVAEAQRRAMQAISPGVKGAVVDEAARATIRDAGYGACFGHGLGHGLGLQVHEAPSLRPNSETVLQPGMVVTVEPGIYLPGWGGVRIEDDVLVTPEGHEVLTHAPKELAELLVFA